MSSVRSNLYNIEKVYNNDNLGKEEYLINAIKEGDAIKVRNLVHQGADVNYKNELGFTPLMYSAVTGIPSITKILLKAGSKIEEKNNRGLTALEISLFNGSYEVFDMLEKNGANTNIIKNLKLSNLELKQNKKYNSIDLIKREVYCDNDKAKDFITNVLYIIEKYKDLRVELILACIALYTMEKDFTNHNLKIFATNNVDISVFTGSNIEYGYLLGAYNLAKNTIQTSNFGGEIESSKTLLHELTHKVHLSCEDLKLDDINMAVLEMKDRLKSIKMNSAISYIQKNMIDRIEHAKGYDKLSLKLLEYLADTISYTILCKRYKKDIELKKTLTYILMPIYKVFDEKIAPNLLEYILQNENLGKLQLSDELKISLRKLKNTKRHNNISLNRKLGIVAKEGLVID